MSFLEFGPEGRRADIVFCHATGFNALTYARLLAPLGDELAIVAPDQRGHGFTTLAADPEGRVDWLDFRDDLIALCSALALEGVVLAGHSMGATVSLLAAAETPGLARALALFDPVVFDAAQAPRAAHPERPAMAEAARRRRDRFPSREAAVTAYLGRGAFASWPSEMIADYVEGGTLQTLEGDIRLACDPAFEAAIYAFQAHDAAAAFESVAAPIAVWRAGRDSTLRLGDREAAITARPNVRIATVEGASHFFPMERPQLVGDALRASAADRARRARAPALRRGPPSGGGGGLSRRRDGRRRRR